MQTRILIIGDEREETLSARQKLAAAGYEVLGIVATVRKAIELAAQKNIDLILVDQMLDGQLDDASFASFIRERFNLPVVFLTDNAAETATDQNTLMVPAAYLASSYEGKELQTAIEMAQYKHQMTNRLQEQEQWLSTILKSIGDAVIATDTAGKITYMNTMAEKLTGWSELIALGMPLAEVIQTIDELTEKPNVDLVQTVLGNPQTVLLADHTLLLQRDGAARPIKGSAARIVGRFNEIQGVVVAFHDVSESRRAKKAFRESEERYRILFEYSPESISIIDLHGTVLDCNEAACSLLNRRRDQIIGRHFLEMGSFDPEDRKQYLRRFAALLRGYEIGAMTIKFSNDLLQTQWVELFPAFLRHDGDIDAIQIIARDITQRKQAEEEVAHYQAHLEDLIEDRTAALELSNERLARSNAELEQYAYVASHELREPLRKIKSFTELLDRKYGPGLDENAQRYISYIVDGSSRMQQLITELFTYARLGETQPDRRPTNMEQIVAEVTSDLELMIQDKGAVIEHEPLPTLNVDAQLYSRLLRNLLANALKFQGEHAPRICVAARPEDKEWVLSVADNGIGLPAEAFDRIFYMFHRLHPRDQYPGHGMGLAICKKIVESHGGRIWVESEPEVGSTFYFTVPIETG
ncbi:MAG: PAS domain S-box protein [Anaerolineales bacterium]|nr:PAS domain S-box protein [Anaerolineales bacterium]MCB0010346.1 PAS domain S-box protein [Anaerolineales bacterium]MCB0016875.1 PAS domain S-box protein [Anaerolineales bacterium]MCB8962430.1 PAS domain S-box protein [Ardenticatenales bacterium]